MITVSELKRQLNITFNTDDVLLQTKIAAAAAHVERLTGKVLLSTQPLIAIFDAFPDAIELPRSPVQSITSIVYRDTDWVMQTLAAAAYIATPLNTDRGTFIHPAKDTSWPDTAELPGSVVVTYVGGYGAEWHVPTPLREAVSLLAAHLYEYREASTAGNVTSVPFGFDDLIMQFRSWAF